MKDYKIDLEECPITLLYDANQLVYKKACTLGYTVYECTQNDKGLEWSLHHCRIWDFYEGVGTLIHGLMPFNVHSHSEGISIKAFLCLPEPTKFVVGNLYKGELGTVVLCTDASGTEDDYFVGTVVSRENPYSLIGHSCNTWSCPAFKPFNGTIVDGVLNES